MGKNKRREFLKNVCPTVALAFFGVTMLEACSSGGDESPTNSGGNNNGGGNNNNTSGYSVSGSTVSITLNNSNFSKLQNDGWMNFTAQNMLLLKIDASTYRAFTNACPHQGARNLWSFDGSNFTCSNHNNSFSASCSGSLRCYETNLEGNILTIEF